MEGESINDVLPREMERVRGIQRRGKQAIEGAPNDLDAHIEEALAQAERAKAAGNVMQMRYAMRVLMSIES